VAQIQICVLRLRTGPAWKCPEDVFTVQHHQVIAFGENDETRRRSKPADNVEPYLYGRRNCASLARFLARLARRADRARPVLALFVVLSQFAVSQCPRQMSAGKFHFEPPSHHSITSSARASRVGGTSRAIRGNGRYGIFRRCGVDQSALMLASRITLPHFSVSSAIS